LRTGFCDHDIPISEGMMILRIFQLRGGWKNAKAMKYTVEKKTGTGLLHTTSFTDMGFRIIKRLAIW
jgi:hypothetical protein